MKHKYVCHLAVAVDRRGSCLRRVRSYPRKFLWKTRTQTTVSWRKVKKDLWKMQSQHFFYHFCCAFCSLWLLCDSWHFINMSYLIEFSDGRAATGNINHQGSPLPLLTTFFDWLSSVFFIFSNLGESQKKNASKK